MPTPESDALRNFFAGMTARSSAQPDMDLATLRDMLDGLQALSAEPHDVTYEEVDAGGRPAIWCVPACAPQDRAILYQHGGAFVGNSMHSHRKLAAHLAKATGVRALILDFRLAPENPFPAQLQDAENAYRWLLDQGFTSNNIASAGDSGGGGLAIALVLKLREDAAPLPAAIIGISPWLDMQAGPGSLDTNAASDAFLSRPLMQNLAAMYLGEHGQATDPLANPLHADLTGLPPVYLSAGGSEALLDNPTRFADSARAVGVDVTLEVSPGMQHVYPLMAGRAAEADRTLTHIGHWLRSKLGLPAVAEAVQP